MSIVLEAQNWISLVLMFAIYALEGWAFIDAAARRPAAFTAGNKMNKTAWMIILGLALAVRMLNWDRFSVLDLAGAVAAIVYVVDVRPVLRSLGRRR